MNTTWWMWSLPGGLGCASCALINLSRGRDARLYPGLARLGRPSDRLQPVYKLAQKGCAQYDKAAECIATAAEIGAPVSGTSEERKFTDAIDCASQLRIEAPASWPTPWRRAPRSKMQPPNYPRD
jgi:hypothetical protein